MQPTFQLGAIAAAARAAGGGSTGDPLVLIFGGSIYTPPDGGSVDLQFDSTTYVPPSGG